jgi:hypothetical protein
MAQRGLVACLAGLVAAMPVALIADTPAQAVGAVTSVAPTTFTNKTTADVHGVAVDHHAGLGLTMMDQTCLSWTLVNGARGGATLQAVLA